MVRKTRRQRQTEATRRSILRAARKLFVRQGYFATTAEDIASAAGVTTGAIYHHFSSKHDIMVYVLETVEQEIVDRVNASAVGTSDALERFSAGNRAFLETCAVPMIARIALKEAPIALGWEKWKQVDDAFSLGLVKRGLSALQQAGVIEEVDIDLTASLILAALMEAGAIVCLSSDVGQTIDQATSTIERMVLGLSRVA